MLTILLAALMATADRPLVLHRVLDCRTTADGDDVRALVQARCGVRSDAGAYALASDGDERKIRVKVVKPDGGAWSMNRGACCGASPCGAVCPPGGGKNPQVMKLPGGGVAVIGGGWCSGWVCLPDGKGPAKCYTLDGVGDGKKRVVVRRRTGGDDERDESAKVMVLRSQDGDDDGDVHDVILNAFGKGRGADGGRLHRMLLKHMGDGKGGASGAPRMRRLWKGADDDGNEIEVQIIDTRDGDEPKTIRMRSQGGRGVGPDAKVEKRMRVRVEKGEGAEEGEKEIEVFVSPSTDDDAQADVRVFVVPKGEKGETERKRIRVKRISEATGVSDTEASVAATAGGEEGAFVDDISGVYVVSLDNEAGVSEDSEDEAPPVKVRVIDGKGDGKKVILKRTKTKADEGEAGDEDKAVVQFPEVWIGVRVTPIPEALAAHLGDEGLMVANVAKNSPADKAGLKQYDVIVSLNGKEISDSKALISGVGEIGPNGEGSLVVLRDGKRKEMSIRPAKRPSGDVEFKYEETPDAIEDEKVNARGGMLKLLPGGMMELEDLGQLKDLPLLLKNHLKDLKIDLPREFQVDIDPGQWNRNWGTIWQGDDEDGKIEVRIIKRGDEGTIEVNRDEEGRITVERKDKDGKATSKSYENIDEVRENDEEAARLLDSMGFWNLRFVGPMGGGHLPMRQRQWQQDIQKSLGRVRDQLNQARTQMRMRAHSSGDGESHTSIVQVNIDEDGKIRIVTEEDGKREEHTFGSKSELKANAPDLYKKYREYLD